MNSSLNIQIPKHLPRIFYRLLLFGLCMPILLLINSCKQKTVDNKKIESNDPNEVYISSALAQSLKFGTPEMSTISGTLRVAAHVETNAQRIAHVGSPVTGRILKLLAFEGQNVKAGTTLATLHSTDLSDTQLALIKAVSQQGLAAAGVKRAEQLVEADVIGHAELERRRAELLQANSEVASYRTQLRGLGMAESQIQQLERSHKLSADYPIVTPKSGTVLKREIAIGQVVQPSDPAFTIADLSSVWIVANVPEEDAGSLHKGLEVEVQIPALSAKEISGKLSYVSPIVDPATRTVSVHMDVANTDGALKPDELASMTFTGHRDRKLTVPNTAVVREENKDYVFVQAAPERFILREVSLGEEENDRRVVFDGVREDEHIVTDGAFHLNNQRKQNAIKGTQ